MLAFRFSSSARPDRVASRSASRAAWAAVRSAASRAMRAERSWTSVWPRALPSASLFRAAVSPSSAWMRALAVRVSVSICSARPLSCSSSSRWLSRWRSSSAVTVHRWDSSPSALRMASSHWRSWAWAVSSS